MAANYQDFAVKPASNKITIAIVETKHQRKIFSGGPVYQCSTSFFTNGVSINGVDLIEVDTTPSQGEFRYLSDQGIVELRLDLDEDPNEKTVFFKYRIFYSTQPLAISSPLSNDITVYYEPRINNQPSLRLELDYENTGTMLETTSSLNLENTDGYFDDKFDQFIWEGQIVRVYSWSEELPISEMKMFYRGKIDSKTFSEKNVTFSIRDQITDLKEKIPYTVYSDADGRVSDSEINRPKRKIFGRADKLRLVGCDKVLGGYPISGSYEGSADRNLLTGLISAVSGNTFMSGSGTLFLSELNIGDEILINDGVFQYTYEVLSIPSNILVNTTASVTNTFNNREGRNQEVLNNKVYGVVTNFKEIFSREDEINVVVDGVEYSYEIEEVVSDTELTLSDEIEATFTEMFLIPVVPYHEFNRKWHIAGHKIRAISHTITAVIDESNFEMDSTSEFQEGDTVFILGFYRIIYRITGLKIRLNQSTTGASISDVIEKVPVPVVYKDTKPFLFSRDFTITNTPTDCFISLESDAEFNVAKRKSVSLMFNFVNGSDVVTVLSTDRDLTTIFKTRDWLITTDITHQIWYEILSVDQLSIRLRVAYAGATLASTAISYKSPDYVNDDSLITADCYGMEWNSEWVKTPAHAVQQMLESIGETEINYDSFDTAKIDCQYVSSLILPATIGADMPTLKDAITLVNKSCFGSLYFDRDFKFTYKVLNSDKPAELRSIKDDDIISFSVSTKNQILGSVVVSYKPYTDQTSGADTFKVIKVESDLVSYTSGIKTETIFPTYLYSDDDAQTIAERWSFFRSLSQSIVKVNAKMSFMLTNLNEAVFLDLERLFIRYGGNGRKKIGIINSVDKDGDSTSIGFNDMGNIFNRVPAICEDDQDDYLFSDSDDIAKFGFIVDNITETPDPLSETDLGNNLIG